MEKKAVAPNAGKFNKLSIQANIKIVALTFRSDHVDASGSKVLQRHAPQKITARGMSITSNVGDVGVLPLAKPEWAVARGGSADSHPITQTKDTPIIVDIDVQFNKVPRDSVINEVHGVGPVAALTFDRIGVSKPVKDGDLVTFSGIISQGKLPNNVDLIDGDIHWTIKLEGRAAIDVGTTGSHRVYVTFDTPGGRMGCPADNAFAEIGAVQVVTIGRMDYATNAAKKKGATERECVDAVFVQMLVDGIGYDVDYVFMPSAPTTRATGVAPVPSLHDYLWLCALGTAHGQCHNIAAAFILVCRILGVTGPMVVGYMVPWPSHKELPEDTQRRGDSKLGAFVTTVAYKPYLRGHSSHGDEGVWFYDGNSMANNFEGVASYGSALYAIGDARFDLFSTADENASSYFAERLIRPTYDATGGIRGGKVDLTKGFFPLAFHRTTPGQADPMFQTECQVPYTWRMTPKFWWHE